MCPCSVLGLTDPHSSSLHRPPPPLWSKLCPPQSALSNAHLPSLPKEGGVILPTYSPPPNHGSTPPCSLGSLDTGAGEGWWGEALKAGDCLGELGDRAPIVPAPEPPQWSSLTQRGFDNGPDISMQNQPLSPLTVPQPRGGSWGAAGSGRQGGAQLRLRRH